MRFRGYYQGPEWKWNLWYRWLGYRRLYSVNLGLIHEPLKAKLIIDLAPPLHNRNEEIELERAINENHRDR